MAYKPRKMPSEEHAESWLMSYADMITLLLRFFIIFVSVSEPREKFFSAAVEGLQAKFGSVNLANPFTSVFRTLEGILDQHDLYRDATLEQLEHGMELEIASSRLFLDNSAELRPDEITVLQKMADAFKGVDFAEYTLVVEGHTSDVALQNHPKFADNWELSSLRAVAVARQFSAHGIAEARLRVAGFAGAEPKLPNTDKQGQAIAENRQKNERIVIRFERVK